MATAQEIITRAYRHLGAIQRGEDPSTDELNDGLDALNDMLNNWSTQHIAIPYREEDTETLSTSKFSYTWGSGGDFTSTRPVSIAEAWLEDTDNNTYPLEIITLSEYKKIAVKNETHRPYRAWYEVQHPLGLLTFESKPDAAYTFKSWSLKEFAELATLGTSSVLPDSYTRALHFNLAVDMAADIGRNPPEIVLLTANSTFNSIKRANLARRTERLSVDNALKFSSSRGRYDIRSG